MILRPRAAQRSGRTVPPRPSRHRGGRSRIGADSGRAADAGNRQSQPQVDEARTRAPLLHRYCTHKSHGWDANKSCQASNNSSSSSSSRSCALCRRRKIRCSRETPCSNCLRSRAHACVYDNPRGNSSRPTSLSSSTPTSSTVGHPSSSLATSPNLESASALHSLSSPRDVHSHSPKSTGTTAANIQKLSTSLSGTFHVNCETGSLARPQTIARSVAHKTRWFGQSHWAVNGVLLIRDVFESIDAHLQRPETSKAWAGIERCKAVARAIKAQRAPQQSPPATPELLLPPRQVSDALVDCYVQSTESMYRVLHVPNFRQAYEAMATTPPRPAFLIQLLLVLALGATTYDENFSLRPSAIQWVGRARAWLAEPRAKAELDMHTLQTHILFVLAQERVGGAVADPSYVLVGTLLRNAIYIGLHRDPSAMAPRTAFAAEMRRRIWNTILELAVQSSLTAGGPPLLSLDDFDTAPPGNYDDDQLTAEDPVPRPADHFSQASVAIALRGTFPQRLAVVRFLNDLASPIAYEKTLQLDAELRTAYRALARTLLAYEKPACRGPSSPSRFELRAVDFLMHRYLLALQIPYFGATLQDSAYAFTRKVVVESSLKIWRAASPGPRGKPQGQGTSSPPETNVLQRLITCTSGFYPTVAIHAAFLIMVELRAQLGEDEGLEPAPLRPDLLSVLGDARTWCLQLIKAGETNVKGYLLVNILATQIEGLMRGLAEDEIARLLIDAVENVEVQCLPLLKAMLPAAPDHKEETSSESLGDLLSAELHQPMEDMGWLSSGSCFDFDVVEPTAWALDVNAGMGMPST